MEKTFLPAESPAMLVIAEADLRRQGLGDALVACWRQWRTERRLARRGVFFRSADPETVAAAYAAMTAEEFEDINSLQDWANGRTIPRCLSGHVPDRPLRIIDLACGTGSSTRSLAWHAPAGSHLSGYELAEPLLTVARRRKYVDREGNLAHVDFICQDLTERLCGIDGAVVLDSSVDVVNASGVLGHHFYPQTIGPLLKEVRRVLRPGGIAMLDVGPTLPERELTRLAGEAGLCKVGHWRSWRLDPTGQVVYRG
jgi:SAM-dependent methyltransferase